MRKGPEARIRIEKKIQDIALLDLVTTNFSILS